MRITNLYAKNWRNFKTLSISLGERVFFVGPNASGKSNLLDIFRFLHDIAKQKGGGLQQAVADRGGISKIRCLASRKSPEIEISVTMISDVGEKWRYEMSISQEQRGDRLAKLKYERVFRDNLILVNRPDIHDRTDLQRLTQTHLEQISANSSFRDVSDFLQSISYLHLIPQVIKHPEIFPPKVLNEDPYGIHFLKRIANTNVKIRTSRLVKIEKALNAAVPQLKQLSHNRDDNGVSHLEAIYKHWRAQGAKQQEDQFSDGTLRLIAFFWMLLENDSLLLLEEPELSLNSSIVRQIPDLMYQINRKKRRQIFISTHSEDLLNGSEISPAEIALLTPTPEGTTVKLAADYEEILSLMRNGIPAGDAVIPKTHPEMIDQMFLPFNE